MSTQRIDSERTIEIVSRHKESVQGFVKRNNLNIYQLNKLIKAETALKNRNSVLNYLRKEKEKLEMENAREKSLEEDVKNTGLGGNKLNNLKDDIVEIREHMTDIIGEGNSNFESPDKKSKIKHPTSQKQDNETEKPKKEPSKSKERKESIGSKDSEKESREDAFSGSLIPDGLAHQNTNPVNTSAKSRRDLQKEVDKYFNIPDEAELEGIASEFEELLPEDKRRNLSSDNTDSPVNVFEEIKGSGNREKALKAAYTVKKTLEKNEDRHLSYNEISDKVKNMEIRKPLDTAEFFEYMDRYDGTGELNFDNLRPAIHDCRRIVDKYS